MDTPHMMIIIITKKNIKEERKQKTWVSAEIVGVGNWGYVGFDRKEEAT